MSEFNVTSFKRFRKLQISYDALGGLLKPPECCHMKESLTKSLYNFYNGWKSLIHRRVGWKRQVYHRMEERGSKIAQKKTSYDIWTFPMLPTNHSIFDFLKRKYTSSIIGRFSLILIDREPGWCISSFRRTSWLNYARMLLGTLKSCLYNQNHSLMNTLGQDWERYVWCLPVLDCSLSKW